MRGWTTRRLQLRQLGPDDARAVSEYGRRSSESQRPWEPVRPPDWWDRAVVAGRLRFELQQAAEDRSLALYIFVREDPHRVIGRITLNNIVRGAVHGCTVGYGLAPNAVGYGYMTEALNEAVRIAFEDLWLHRVELNAIPRNARSIALAERCGFEREGVARQMLHIAGVWEDHVRFARLNDAWVGKP